MHRGDVIVAASWFRVIVMGVEWTGLVVDRRRGEWTAIDRDRAAKGNKGQKARNGGSGGAAGIRAA